MPRPFCKRRLNACPPVEQFIPVRSENEQRHEMIILTLDEFEALRLADYMGMYHEEAGQQMGVSRPTFSRIVEQARRKVAEALVEGKQISIMGGPVNFMCRQKGRNRHCHRHCKRETCFPESENVENKNQI